MPAVSRAELRRVVCQVVKQIPHGRVLSYGGIARLAGWPRHARLVGHIMRTLSDTDYPCHRVVAADGRLAPHYAEQAERLAAEGVEINAHGRVDMLRYEWNLDLVEV